MAGYGKGYDNSDDAAAAASQLLERQPNIKDREYATVIYQDTDGKYYRTQLNTDDQAGKASLGSLFYGLTKGQKPVAVLHNHPGGLLAKFDPKYLSDADTKLGADGARVGAERSPSGPLKMYLLANGLLRQGNGQMRRTQGQDRQQYTLQDTDKTLAQFPIDELIEHIDNRNPFAKAAAAVRAKSANPMVAATERP